MKSTTLRFDIKDHTPHKDKPYDQLKVHVRQTYHEINFMVHLLWELHYSVVHGEFRDLIPEVLEKIKPENGWPSEYAAARPILEQYLGDMASEQVVQDGLKHLDLYLGYNADARGFVQLSSDLRDALLQADPRFRLCLPYIDLQQDEAYVPIDPVQLNDAAGKIARFTILQLYWDPNARDEKQAILYLRREGVLRTRTSSTLAGGQGNDHKCDNNDCVPYADSYCSKDEDGNCSAMSDP